MLPGAACRLEAVCWASTGPLRFPVSSLIWPGNAARVARGKAENLGGARRLREALSGGRQRGSGGEVDRQGLPDPREVLDPRRRPRSRRRPAGPRPASRPARGRWLAGSSGNWWPRGRCRSRRSGRRRRRRRRRSRGSGWGGARSGRAPSSGRSHGLRFADGELAVVDLPAPGQCIGDRQIMSGDDQAGARVKAGLQQDLDDRGAVDGIELAGRLIGEDQARLPGEGAGDGDPLGLATGDLLGQLGGQLTEVERGQRSRAPSSSRRRCRHRPTTGAERRSRPR